MSVYTCKLYPIPLPHSLLILISVRVILIMEIKIDQGCTFSWLDVVTFTKSGCCALLWPTDMVSIQKSKLC